MSHNGHHLFGINLMNHTPGPACIIAEAGINHGGSFDKARKLIEIAAQAKCTCVKFQTFSTDDYMSINAISAPYIVKGSRKNETFYQLSKRFEQTHDEQKELFRYSKSLGIPWISSFFDEPSLNFLAELGVQVLKVASGEMTDFPLLKKAAKTKIPLIVSTGMASMQEIEETVAYLKSLKVRNLFLMHCVSWYPAKVDDMNIMLIDKLWEKYKIPVGLSDHTLGINVSIGARTRGVKFFEKHFTYSKKAFGPDHSASIELKELKEMVRGIDEVGRALGNGVKKLLDVEYRQRQVHRKSVVANCQIPRGTVLTSEMLGTKRPGLGIEPKFLESLLGCRTKKDIPYDQVIQWNMLSRK